MLFRRTAFRELQVEKVSSFQNNDDNHNNNNDDDDDDRDNKMMT